MKTRAVTTIIIVLALCSSGALAQGNTPPTVEAGPDQTVPYGLSISLAPSTSPLKESRVRYRKTVTMEIAA